MDASMNPPKSARLAVTLQRLALPLCLAAVLLSSGCDQKSPSLLTNDLTNARFDPGTWSMNDGVLRGNGKGGMLWTDKEYGNFQLDLEFRVGEDANSGIFLRCPNPGAMKKNRVHHHQNALEFEIIRMKRNFSATNGAASLLTVQGPSSPVTLEPGKWHVCSITAKDSVITATLDGKQLYACDLTKWTRPGKNPDGSPNSLKPPLKDLPKKGHIGFQDYIGRVEFRNIQITEL